MKKFLVSGLAVACLALVTAQVRADCCPPTVTYVDKVVTCYKPVWKTEKVQCVVNRVYCRVENVPVQCTFMVPKWKEVKETCTYLVPVPRIVESAVVRCHYVPVPYCDPCTGCTYTCMKPTLVTEKVKCTVFDCKEETRVVTRKVCYFEPQVRTLVKKHFIPECRQEIVERLRPYCEMVPYQATIKVPVCVPGCPPPMPYADHP